MYYVEMEIDGVLCCQTVPNGPWRPLTAKELTEKILYYKSREY